MKMKRLTMLLLAAALAVCAAVLPAAAEGNAQGIDLTGHIVILHTGDSHGWADGNLGFGRVAYAKDVLEGAGATVLLLDSGDALHGLPFVNISKGESIVRLMNEAGYDAMAAGSHDFSYGADRLHELDGQAKFPMLAANVLKEDGSPLLAGSVIFERNNVKFGIFGLTTPETVRAVAADKLTGLTFEDPVETAKAVVASLETENCTLIIALTHLGVEENGGITAEMLAGQVPGIDVIVDGGSHTLLEEGVWAGGSLIVSAGEHIGNIGCVDIDPTGLTAATMLTNEDFGAAEGDEAVRRLLAEIAEAQEELFNVSVGSAAVDLNGAQEAVCAGETNFGNFAADALRGATGAEIALINGGAVRASVPAGEITKKQLAEAFPSGNYAVTMEVTGDWLLAALENGVSLYPAAEGCFPQVSGMSFKFDPAQPAGSRVFDVKVNDEPLDAARTYTLAVIDSIANGEAGYPLTDAPAAGGFAAMDEILAEYIGSFTAPIEPGLEGRIIAEARAAE